MMFGNNMQEAMMNRMFRRVDGLCWDMTTGKMAVQTQEGLVTASIDEDDHEKSQIEINLMSDFGMPIPAFAQGTKVQDIKVGDIVINNGGILGWVIKAQDNQFKLLSISGQLNTWNPPKVTMMGFESGTLIVRSLLGVVGGSGVQNLQSLMMPMMMSGLMSGDEGGMLDRMMPMLLMSMQAGSAGVASDAAGMQSMMQTMLLMEMLANKNQHTPAPSSIHRPSIGSMQPTKGSFFTQHN